MTSKKQTTPKFEKALADLQKIVSQMEQGDLSLEDSLKSFEKGIQLTRQCQETLQKAEQKVKILLEKNQKVLLEPFDSKETE